MIPIVSGERDDRPMPLFAYVEDANNGLEVGRIYTLGPRDPRAALDFFITDCGITSLQTLPRAEVVKLRDALTRWLEDK